MIRKYQNELIVLAAFLFLLGGFLYQKSMSNTLDHSLDLAKRTARQITETKILQKVWETKGLKEQVSGLRTALPAAKVKKFEQGKGKLTSYFADLTGQELNMISTKFASLPVHIEKFTIDRSGNRYKMECDCSW